MMSSVPRSAELNTLTDARMRRLPHEQQLHKAEYPGEITYLDVFSVSKFDLPVESIEGKRSGYQYAVLFVDAYSRFRKVYFCKTQEEVPRLARFYLLELGTQAHSGGHFLLGAGFAKYGRRQVHTDGGLPMNSEAFERVLLECGCAANVTSCHDSPSSNGVVERSFGTLVPDVRALLALPGMGKRHWHWAFRHAVVARNRLASRRVVDPCTGKTRRVTPFELFFGRKPSLAHAVIFGSPCRVLLLGPERPKGKFGMPCSRGVVLGHGEDGVQVGKTFRYMMGWVVLREDGSTTVSRNVEIDERPLIEGGHYPISGRASSRQRDADVSSRRAADEQRDAADQRDADGQRDADAPLQRDVEHEFDELGESAEGVEIEGRALPPISLAHDPLRRDRASHSKSQAAGGSEPLSAQARVANGAVYNGKIVKIPGNLKEALNSDEKDEWNRAVAEHLAMHDAKGTFKEVLVPARKKLLPCRWVFAVKTDSENSVIRFKARTVVWGNMQRQGIDYEQTFSPTARGEQIRILLAAGAKLHGERLSKLPSAQVGVLSASLDDVLIVGDVEDAYLNSTLEEGNVLTEFPPGYVPKLTAPPGFVVAAEQIQAHPGLKQAGRAWFRNNRARLLERGFKQSEIAPCIFVKETPCGGFIAVAVYWTTCSCSTRRTIPTPSRSSRPT